MDLPDLRRRARRGCRQLGPDLSGVTVEPKVGIGQQAHLVRTPVGNLRWEVAAIATSHLHRIPLSARVVERVTTAVERYAFDRLYDNFGGTIDTDARAIVRRSADRYIGWVSGDFDHLR